MNIQDTPGTVLIVDDHARNRALLGANLASVACKVQEAADGYEALAIITAEPPDVILLDVMMPGLDGYTVTKQLKADPRTATIPVVLVTALSDTADRRRGLEAGADEFLTKPVDRVELVARVRTLLRLKRLHDERDAHQQLLLASSDQRFHDLVQGLDAIVWEAEGVPPQFTFVSQQANTVLGYPVERWLADRTLWANAIHPADRESTLARCRAAFEAGEHHDVEYRAITADGRCVWLRHIARVVGEDDGRPRRLRGIMVDISQQKQYETERKQAEVALRVSEERYVLAARGANDGLWDWQLETNEVYFSPRWKSMLGFDEEQISNRVDEWIDRVHPEDVQRTRAELAAHLEGRTPHFESEHRVLHRDETYRWMLCRGLAVRDESGSAYRMAGSQTDITERKEAEAQLLHDALHDGLTGLSNRALFLDRLGRLVSRVRRHSDYLFAVIWVDIDRFKVVNDSLGHLIGDELLIQMGHRLEACLRASDTVARIGGDEFTILLDDIASTSDAIRVAERIHEALSAPFKLNDQEIYASASMGIALSAPEYEGPEDIMRDADTAMYRAKALGKACHVVFDGSMHARAVALLELETSLRRAVERQEFRVHYQPIVSLNSEELIGFEALVRWQHPDRGLVFPGDFIAVAEDTGLVLPMGRWVLGEACRQLREWQARFPTAALLWVSVNLSSKQLAQPDIAEQIRQVLEETGLPGRSLKLEITESMLMESIDSAATVLEQLRALDIQVSVDDFGTGYSCLSYLHRLPLDTLKVDRSFVNGLGVDEERSAIVRTVITLAHNLGLEVVAEGVETREQAQLLRALGCRYGQGYLFSKPIDGEKAEQLVAAEAHAWAV